MRTETLVEVDDDGKVLLPVLDTARATHYRIEVNEAFNRIELYPMKVVTSSDLRTDADGYTARQRKAMTWFVCPTCEAPPGSKCHVKNKPGQLLENNGSRWVEPVHRRRVDLVSD